MSDRNRVYGQDMDDRHRVYGQDMSDRNRVYGQDMGDRHRVYGQDMSDRHRVYGQDMDDRHRVYGQDMSDRNRVYVNDPEYVQYRLKKAFEENWTPSATNVSAGLAVDGEQVGSRRIAVDFRPHRTITHPGDAHATFLLISIQGKNQ